MYTIYGIKNCGSMKKAFAVLDGANIHYQFFNYKTQDVTREMVVSWVDKLGLDAVLNKRGTTWRKQSDATKLAAQSSLESAIALMVANPSMIKRPILEGSDEHAGVLLAGFDEKAYENLVN